MDRISSIKVTSNGAGAPSRSPVSPPTARTSQRLRVLEGVSGVPVYPIAVPAIAIPWMIPKEAVRSSGATRTAT